MADSIYTWSTTAGSNAGIDSGVSCAEGQSAGSVNNGMRGMMGRNAEFVKDLGGSLTAGGTADALTVTANSAFSAYLDGMILSFRAASDNTTACTLNVNSIGAKALRKMDSTGDVALTAGEIQATGIYLVQYQSALNAAAGAWLVMNPTLSASVYAGWTPIEVTTGAVTSSAVTGVPSWATEIDILLNGLSLNGATNLILQLGDSGGIEASGYTCTHAQMTAANTFAFGTNTTSFILTSATAADAPNGILMLRRTVVTGGGFLWNMTFQASDGNKIYFSSGNKATSAALDRFQLGSANGTSTFDAGTFSYKWR